MGLACKIERDDRGNIMAYDSNERESELYKGLVREFARRDSDNVNTQLSDEERSVYDRAIFRQNYLLAPNGNITQLSNEQWLLVRTPSFIQRYGDWTQGSSEFQLDENGEPVFTDEAAIRSTLDRSNFSIESQQKALLLWGIAQSRSMQDYFGTAEPSVDRMLEVYDNNGDLTALAQGDLEMLSAISSNTTSTTIQLAIANTEQDNPVIIKKINSTINDINYDPIEYPSVISDIIDLSSERELGVQARITGTDLLNRMDEVYIGNVEVESDILDLASDVSDNVYESIVDNPALQRKLFLYYRNMEYAPVYRYTENGLQQEANNSFRTATRSYLLNNQNSSRELTLINVLRHIDETTWQDQFKHVRSVLDELETQLVNRNIDAVGLSDLAVQKGREETINYLNAASDLLTFMQGGVATQSDIDTYVDSHNSFFNIEESEKEDKIRNTNKQALMYVNTPLSAEQMFDRENLLHLHDNVYLKISDTDMIAEAAHERIAGVPDYIYDGKALDSQELKDALIRFITPEIGSYNFSSRTKQLNYAMARYLFGSEETLEDSGIFNKVRQVQLLRNSDFDFVQNGFAPLFYNYILQNKKQNTILYNRVLKYFSVNENGLNVEGNLSTIKQELANFYDELPTIFADNLFSYASISTNTNIQNLVETLDADVASRDDLVEASILNPNIVPEATEMPTDIQEGFVEFSTEQPDIVSYNNTLYKLSDVTNNIYTSDMAISEVEGLKDLYKEVATYVEQAVSLSRSESERVDEQIDDCF